MPENLQFGGVPGAPPDVVRNVQPDTEPNGAVPGSLLDKLRKAAAKQQEEHTEDFMVGGEFRKQLWIRYKPLDPEPMDAFITRRGAIRDRMAEDPKASLPMTELNMDLMAQGCVAVLGADENGENREVLTDSQGTIRLEHRLCVLLDLPVPTEEKLTAREVIMIIFGGNAIAIVDHGDDVLGWMRDPVGWKPPGESSAPTGSGR
jgi:hypothetical protein